MFGSKKNEITLKDGTKIPVSRQDHIQQKNGKTFVNGEEIKNVKEVNISGDK
jgi:hypothetical protein